MAAQGHSNNKVPIIRYIISLCSPEYIFDKFENFVRCDSLITYYLLALINENVIISLTTLFREEISSVSLEILIFPGYLFGEMTYKQVNVTLPKSGLISTKSSTNLSVALTDPYNWLKQHTEAISFFWVINDVVRSELLSH